MLAEPGAGEQLGRYELVAEIASGGMATVYLARALGMEDFRRFFAVKRLHPHLNKDPDFVAMFVDEARLAARIHHPNVVPIFEIGLKDQQYFLVMDYVEGDTASRLVIRSKHLGRSLPLGFTTRVIVETLAGLHAAHELTTDDGTPLELVHRDVSPQNILVGVDGVSRITDFGVARAAARIGDQTQGGQLKGKLAYMAPEQIRGGAVDRRVDVFAAGIVLWEMIAGERLFKADTDGETLFKVAAAEVPDLITIVPDLPPAIAAVCHRALSKDPNERFTTAADFGDTLEEAARAAGQMFTGRESAALVNDLVGQDITAHRDLVRTWLSRSDVSRSGVALAQPFSPPQRQVDDAPTPESGSHATPPAADPLAQTRENEEAAPLAAPRELGSLISDHEDLATRLDLEVEVAPPVDADGMPTTNPAPPPATPAVIPQIAHLQTVREFMPMGAQMEAPPTSAPMSMPPQSAPSAMPVAPAAGSGGRLPAWTLAIPVVLVVLAGGIVLAMKMGGGPAVTTTPAATTPAATTAATATTPTAETTTAVPTSTVAVTPTTTTTTTSTTTTTTTSRPATPTATATAMATIKPTATVVPTATASHKKIDNSSFGGRK